MCNQHTHTLTLTMVQKDARAKYVELKTAALAWDECTGAVKKVQRDTNDKTRTVFVFKGGDGEIIYCPLSYAEAYHRSLSPRSIVRSVAKDFLDSGKRFNLPASYNETPTSSHDHCDSDSSDDSDDSRSAKRAKTT